MRECHSAHEVARCSRPAVSPAKLAVAHRIEAPRSRAIQRLNSTVGAFWPRRSEFLSPLTSVRTTGVPLTSSINEKVWFAKAMALVEHPYGPILTIISIYFNNNPI